MKTNKRQLLKQVQAKLNKYSEPVTAEAERLFMTYHKFKAEDSQDRTMKEAALHYVKSKPFDFLLYWPLLAALGLTAFRVIDKNSESGWLYGFGIFSMEAFTELIIIYGEAVKEDDSEEAEPNQVTAMLNKFSLPALVKYVIKWLTGFDFKLMNILLMYIIIVGGFLHLNFQIGLTGEAARVSDVLLALLPVVVIGIVSHIAGRQTVTYIRHQKKVKGLWREEALDFVLDVLEAKASNGTRYAQEALAYYEYLLAEAEREDGLEAVHTSSLINSIGSVSSASSQLFEHAQNRAGFGFAGMASAGQTEHNRTNGTAEPLNNMTQKHRARLDLVLDTYPDILTQDNPHDLVADLLDIKRGGTTKRLLDDIEAGYNRQ